MYYFQMGKAYFYMAAFCFVYVIFRGILKCYGKSNKANLNTFRLLFQF